MKRSAFTLIEVLLALALVVALGAATWPVLQRPWAGHKLLNAADQVRAQWGKARVHAMSSGETVVFRYSPDGARYQTEAKPNEASAEAPLDDALAGPGLFTAEEAALMCDERELPKGVTFLAAEVAEDSRSVAEDASAEPIADREGEWSGPIYFFPDGTCTTARILLANEYEDCVEVALRGLTGVAKVSELRTVAELRP